MKHKFNSVFFTATSLVAFLLGIPNSVFAHGDLHERIEDVSRELETQPNAPDLLFERGSLYEQHGDHAAALADFVSVEKIDSSFEGLHFAKARSYFGSENYESSLAELDQIQPPASEEGHVYLWRGRILAKLDQPLNAATNYRKAFAKIEHASPDVYIEYSRAVASAGTNHYAIAIAGLDEGIKRIGPVITLNLEALELELAIGQNLAALERLETILETTPNLIPLWKKKGEILQRLNREADAVSAYEHALALIDRLPASRRSTTANRELDSAIRAKLTADTVGVSN